MQAQPMTDTDRVSTRLARVGLPGWMVLIACRRGDGPNQLLTGMIVRGRAVVVIRVIVADVLVDVQ